METNDSQSIPPVSWRLHLKSPPEKAFMLWTTDEGRIKFWVELSESNEKEFQLTFINGETVTCRIIKTFPYESFDFTYFEGTTVQLKFEKTPDGGTDFKLTESGYKTLEHRNLHYAGWLNVLFPFKAMCDYGIDLRNHDRTRTWEEGFADC